MGGETVAPSGLGFSNRHIGTTQNQNQMQHDSSASPPVTMPQSAPLDTQNKKFSPLNGGVGVPATGVPATEEVAKRTTSKKSTKSTTPTQQKKKLRKNNSSSANSDYDDFVSPRWGSLRRGHSSICCDADGMEGLETLSHYRSEMSIAHCPSILQNCKKKKKKKKCQKKQIHVLSNKNRKNLGVPGPGNNSQGPPTMPTVSMMQQNQQNYMNMMQQNQNQLGNSSHQPNQQQQPNLGPLGAPVGTVSTSMTMNQMNSMNQNSSSNSTSLTNSMSMLPHALSRPLPTVVQGVPLLEHPETPFGGLSGNYDDPSYNMDPNPNTRKERINTEETIGENSMFNLNLQNTSIMEEGRNLNYTGNLSSALRTLTGGNEDLDLNKTSSTPPAKNNRDTLDSVAFDMPPPFASPDINTGNQSHIGDNIDSSPAPSPSDDCNPIAFFNEGKDGDIQPHAPLKKFQGFEDMEEDDSNEEDGDDSDEDGEEEDSGNERDDDGNSNASSSDDDDKSSTAGSLRQTDTEDMHHQFDNINPEELQSPRQPLNFSNSHQSQSSGKKLNHHNSRLSFEGRNNLTTGSMRSAQGFETGSCWCAKCSRAW